MRYVWILAAFAIVVCIFAFLRLRVRLYFALEEGGRAVLSLRIWPFRIEYAVFLSVCDDGIYLNVEKGKRIKRYRLYQALRTPFGKKGLNVRFGAMARLLPKCVRIARLRLDAALGIEQDAAATALITGYLQALLYAALAPYGYRTGSRPEISIRPMYGKNALRFSLRCIASVHVGKSILAAIQLIRSTRKERIKRSWRIQLKTS